MRGWLEAAESAALLAGHRLRHRLAGEAVLEERAHDIKLAADRAAEDLIAGPLRAATGLPVFSEETGWIGTPGEFAWIVDPLDGSYNYDRGLPIVAVSIGLVRGLEPVLGVINLFALGELFVGVVGEGAWRNGERVQVSDLADQRRAILATGFPAARDLSPEALLPFAEDVGRWGKVRMLGSAAASLAFVACGRVDAYREERIRFWDVAAGLALVLGAGGRVETRFEERETPGDALAWNGRLPLSRQEP